MQHPSNNFDFWRICAASMVLVSHQFALLGMVEPTVAPNVKLGTLGVCIFFVVSGFLVTQSWVNDPHVLRFGLRRFLRIWPGLAVVTLLSVFVLGPLVTTLPLGSYFSAGDTWRHFSALFLKIRFTLPGVFETNPYPDFVNGSLWTIPIEVRWYIVLAVAGLLRFLQWRYLVLAAFLILGAHHFAVERAQADVDPSFFREFGLFFIYGTLLFLFQDVWSRRPWLWGALLLAVGLTLNVAGQRYLGIALALPFAVIWLGLKSTPVVRRFGRFGDLSYGIYVYAFPVQQLVVWSGGARFGYAVCLAASATVTVVLAFLSWHTVEKPALALKPRSGSKAGRRPLAYPLQDKAGAATDRAG